MTIIKCIINLALRILKPQVKLNITNKQNVSILATTCLESPPNRSTPTIVSEGNFHSFNSFQPVLHLSNIPPITNIPSFDSPPFLSPSGEYDYFNEFTVFILYLFETKHCVHLNPAGGSALQIIQTPGSLSPPLIRTVVPFGPTYVIGESDVKSSSDLFLCLISG